MTDKKKKTVQKEEAKPTEKKEESEDPQKQEKRTERQLLKIIGFIAVLVVIFFVAKAYFDARNSIEYEGLTFLKERVSGIEAYKYSYFFVNPQTNDLVNYVLYIRNNPKENPVPLIGDPIVFQQGRFVYVSLDMASIEQCPQSVLAVGDLSRFISGNGITVRPGSLTEEEAEERDRRYVTCETTPDRVVIEIASGEETKITINDKCHRITVADCNILPATEKYIVQSLLDAREPAQDTALPPSIE